MTAFRTKIELSKSEIQLTHTDRILGLGSCFAQHIGVFFEKYKFKSLVNPFGILYNPISICKNLNRVMEQKPWTKEELIPHNDLWQSFDHHGSYSDPNLEVALHKINDSYTTVKNEIEQCTTIIITFGTAYIYSLKRNGQVVANCHKFPADQFNRRLLIVEEILEAFDGFIARLKEKNINVKIILTVSPIRHLKDGMIENQCSKATLLLAVQRLCVKHSEVYYFPSYEIMMDDLRDYRFYAKDMIHPSEAAVDYIKNQFREYFVSEKSQDLIRQLDKIIQAANHRPFNPGTAQHQAFVLKQLNKIKELGSKFEALDLTRERQIFESQLINS